MANLDERPSTSDVPRPSMMRRLRGWRIGCGAGFGCMILAVAFFALIWWLTFRPAG
jgi:hypothetical protein